MKNLFFRLLNAQDEESVTKLINNNSQTFAQKNWFPVDNNDNNFGLIESQGKNPERALIEKITNAIDAVLIRECKARKIDPESSSAPKSIKQALELFFKIENGDLNSITKEKKDKLASLIYVVAENFKDKRANFYLIDKGEGQSPKKFKETFLKFGGNKSKTYFVHGRFGTGSFGVLPNCGDNKYQLILSKSFLDESNLYGSWGWTLIRKNRSQDVQTKHAWYEYLTNDGEIFEFLEKDLAKSVKDCIKYSRLDLSSFSSGTVIKLYSYDLPYSSDVDRDLNRIFNRYLFAPALPFRILDAQTKSNVGPGKEVDGNLNRLKKNKEELEGPSIPTTKIQKVLLPKLGSVDIDIYIAKKRKNKKSFIESERISNNNECIFFIRNGQSHGEFSRQFLRDNLGLEYIAKDIAIYIDCSESPSVEFDDVFPPTRDSMRENRHRIAVEAIIKNELKNNEFLKEFNMKRRSEAIAESIEKTKDFETFINDLLSIDPAFRKLLTGPLRISDLSAIGTGTETNYEGRNFPTFLKIKDNEIKSDGYKSIPINTYARIILETDAKNDYLYRDADKGELLFDFKGRVGSYKLYNGRLTLKVLPPELTDKLINTEEKITITLTRAYDEPLSQEIIIKYTEPEVSINNPTQPPPTTKTKQLALPKPNTYSKQAWLDLGYEENDACELVVEKDESETAYILKEVNMNADFSGFKDYLKSQSISQRKIEEMKNQFIQALYISAIVVHKDFSTDHSYKRDEVRTVLTQLGRSLPFILFTMQKRWLKEIILPEEENSKE